MKELQNGVNLDFRNGTGTYYDALGRPTQYLHIDTNQAPAETLIGFKYAYDRAGNKLYQVSIHDEKDTQRYAYDSSNRLTAFVRGTWDPDTDDVCDDPSASAWSGETEARRWNLDGLGNWDSVWTTVNGSETQEDRSSNAFNEYTAIGGVSQSHDDNGNLTSGTEHLYVWDAFNRLVEVQTPQGAPIAVYYYDSGNRRVRKTVAASPTATPGPTPTTTPTSTPSPTQSSVLSTHYYYSAWQVLEETAGCDRPNWRRAFGRIVVVGI